MMTLEITEKSLAALEEQEEIELLTFPAEFVSKLGGGIARCLNEDGKPYSIRSDEPYEIPFLAPAYVANVKIVFSKPVVGAGIELSIHDALSNKTMLRKLKKQTLSNELLFTVNCVTSGISIFLERSFFEVFGRRTLEIKQIRISGFTSEDFEKLTNSLTTLQGFREAAIGEISAEKSALQNREEKAQQREITVSQLEAAKKSKLSSLQEALNTAEEETSEATKNLTKLKDEIERSETQKKVGIEQVSKLEATVRSIESEVSKGKEQLRALAVETSEAERRLQTLTSNVNLFSEEFSSFSDHGAKQARTFIYLSIIPLFVIAILTGQLLMGAVDLSVKYVKQPDIDLLTIFVTRLPYLAICGSILAVCYSVLRFLFQRISVIYSERLDFSKIGIIAKDVATSSSHGLQLADQQLYEARTYLKIEMLKSYLSGNIGAFTYKAREFKTLDSTEKTELSPALEAVPQVNG